MSKSSLDILSDSQWLSVAGLGLSHWYCLISSHSRIVLVSTSDQQEIILKVKYEEEKIRDKILWWKILLAESRPLYHQHNCEFQCGRSWGRPEERPEERDNFSLVDWCLSGDVTCCCAAAKNRYEERFWSRHTPDIPWADGVTEHSQTAQRIVRLRVRADTTLNINKQCEWATTIVLYPASVLGELSTDDNNMLLHWGCQSATHNCETRSPW